jgi:hypothetical protein
VSQLVTVDGRYTYRWPGDEPLEVGDLVLLPGNWLIRDPFPGTVTALDGGSYDGPISTIIKRLPPAVPPTQPTD